MAKLTMKEIKNLIKQEDNKKQKNNYGDSNIYPFWNMNPDEEAIVRFLPDKNKENPFPYVEKLEHKLSVDGEMVKIPCLKQYGEDCPICNLSKKYYDTGDKDSGKYYYRTRYHMARVLVLKDPLPKNEETGENFEGKVVNVQLSFQIMEKIKEQLASDSVFDDDDALPWDLENGFNFTIKKMRYPGSNGGYYDKYDIGSTFARKPTGIPDEHLGSLSLVDLKTLLPEKPGTDYVNEMLENHLSGGGMNDNDSLESKKSSSTKNTSDSKKKDFLNKLMNDDEDDDPDDDDNNEGLSDTAAQVLSDITNDSSTSSNDNEENDEDDDIDDIDDLVAKIRKKRQG